MKVMITTIMIIRKIMTLIVINDYDDDDEEHDNNFSPQVQIINETGQKCEEKLQMTWKNKM